MNTEEFNAYVRSVQDATTRLLLLKGGEYSQSSDRLSNFKLAADRLHLTKYDIWSVYFDKHLEAIRTFISDTKHGIERERSEPIAGRIHDAINYLILLGAIIEEDESSIRTNRHAARAAVTQLIWDADHPTNKED